MRPRLLDLFSCEGVGASGYVAAGWDVFCVDTDADALSRNPYPSALCDALLYLERHGREFTAIHASPPCQASTTMSNKHRGKGGRADQWANLIGPTRDLLTASGKPWVLENVPGARSSMVNPLLLHGGMFGLGVNRPRLFDSNVLLMRPPGAPLCSDPVGVYGKAHDGRLLFIRGDGSRQLAAGSLEQARKAMGGPAWASWRGLCEAIPPAYTAFIGEQMLAAVQSTAA